MQSAQMTGTNLSRAKMEMAQLADAKITLCSFSGADLSYADLSHAVINESDFSNSNVNMAKMHEVLEADNIWTGANKSMAQGTSEERKKAEQWGKK
jgi:uncharacterized protein YjbI with pentapeptide repeats